MLFRPISRGVVDEKVTVLSFAQLILRHATSVHHDAHGGQDLLYWQQESRALVFEVSTEICRCTDGNLCINVP